MREVSGVKVEWTPKVGERVEVRNHSGDWLIGTVCKVYKEHCDINTDNGEKWIATNKPYYLRPVAPTTRPENVLENEPEFNTSREPPYDMDAAFVQDRLAALKRLMPALDADGKPLQKPEPQREQPRLTPADVLGQDAKTRKWAGM